MLDNLAWHTGKPWSIVANSLEKSLRRDTTLRDASQTHEATVSEMWSNAVLVLWPLPNLRLERRNSTGRLKVPQQLNKAKFIKNLRQERRKRNRTKRLKGSPFP